jgi:hypothetical protein
MSYFTITLPTYFCFSNTLPSVSEEKRKRRFTPERLSSLEFCV